MSGRGRRRSSWRNGDPALDTRQQHASTQRQETISLLELHLLQRIRQVGAGSHNIFLMKTQDGRDGFHSFHLVENTGEPWPDEETETS